MHPGVDKLKQRIGAEIPEHTSFDVALSLKRDENDRVTQVVITLNIPKED